MNESGEVMNEEERGEMLREILQLKLENRSLEAKVARLEGIVEAYKILLEKSQEETGQLIKELS